MNLKFIALSIALVGAELSVQSHPLWAQSHQSNEDPADEERQNARFKRAADLASGSKLILAAFEQNPTLESGINALGLFKKWFLKNQTSFPMSSVEVEDIIAGARIVSQQDESLKKAYFLELSILLRNLNDLAVDEADSDLTAKRVGLPTFTRFSNQMRNPNLRCLGGLQSAGEITATIAEVFASVAAFPIEITNAIESSVNRSQIQTSLARLKPLQETAALQAIIDSNFDLQNANNFKLVEDAEVNKPINGFFNFYGGGIQRITVVPSLTRYWAQEIVGSDLAKEYMRENGLNRKVKVGLIDTGFNMNAIHPDQVETSIQGEKLEREGLQPYQLDHGTAVANIVLGKGSLGISESAFLAEISVDNDRKFSIARLDPAKKLEAVGMSMTMGNSSEDLENYKIIAEESVFVVSAGNHNFLPLDSAMDINSIIIVGSLDSSGLVSDYSQLTDRVDILAPSGHHIQTFYQDEIKSFGGTSGAQPVVLGTVANILAILPGISVTTVKEILKASASSSVIQAKNPDAAGIVNTYRAVRLSHALAMRCSWGDSISEACIRRTLKESGHEIFSEFKREAQLAHAEAASLIKSSNGNDKKLALKLLRKSALLFPTTGNTLALEKAYNSYVYLPDPNGRGAYFDDVGALFKTFGVSPSKVLSSIPNWAGKRGKLLTADSALTFYRNQIRTEAYVESPNRPIAYLRKQLELKADDGSEMDRSSRRAAATSLAADYIKAARKSDSSNAADVEEAKNIIIDSFYKDPEGDNQAVAFDALMNLELNDSKKAIAFAQASKNPELRIASIKFTYRAHDFDRLNKFLLDPIPEIREHAKAYIDFGIEQKTYTKDQLRAWYNSQQKKDLPEKIQAEIEAFFP